MCVLGALVLADFHKEYGGGVDGGCGDMPLMLALRLT